MYSIAAAADLTGLDEDTIRDWEGTYGLFAPRRAESGHRGYHDNDLRALGAMASLLDVGWGPAEAAAEANGRARRGPVAPPPREPVLARPRDDLTVTFMSAAADLDVATLGEVLDAAWAYADATGRRISIEYALIKDVNDQRWRAELLADLLVGHLVHVNLIPLNPTPGSKWTASRRQDERAFVRALEDRGVPVTVRDTRGREIDGACGQLAAATA